MKNTAKDCNFTVYCHVNKSNGKRYFGITSREPIIRWGKNGDNYRSNKHFFNAIQKYGWDGFEHLILHRGLSLSVADRYEREYIASYHSDCPDYGYNHTTGGEMNREYSEESRKKMSEAAQNRVVSDEWKQHLSESHKGIRPWNVGISPSPETIEKIRISSTGRKHSNESKQLMKEKSWNKKRVMCDGIVFNSITDCANYLSVSRNQLSSWLNGEYSFSEEYVNRGIGFEGVSACYVKACLDIIPKSVICDGVIFDSMLACDKYYNLPRCSVSSWLIGGRKMPQKFVDMGLAIYQSDRYFYKILDER